MNPSLNQFKKEINSYYLVLVINIVFAALVMAFGICYMITIVLGLPLVPEIPVLRMLTYTVAMVCFGLGLSWFLTTRRIFEGIRTIRENLCASEETMTEDRIMCLIVRMLAHYRINRKTIGTMIFVSKIVGCFFCILGIAASLQVLSLSLGSITFSFNNLMVIPAMLLTLGIALTSLVSSFYFSKFAHIWDQRLREIDESECTLKKTLGLD
ncbi:MAG: hypothetical protein PHF39_11195 [Methanoregula sp.]|nr:hypothetical protein [Methanoregula sp.]